MSNSIIQCFHSPDYLYWCDLSFRRIERIDFNGTKRTIIIQPAQHVLPSSVLSLMITGNFLSWTVEYERSFFTIRTDNFTSGAVEVTDLSEYLCRSLLPVGIIVLSNTNNLFFALFLFHLLP